MTEILHGVPVADPYRWLEDQDSSSTRQWLTAQTKYIHSYLGAISGRERIRKRVRQLLDMETTDSIQKVGSGYFFRKRLSGQEQPSICFRETLNGPDEVLIDPAMFGAGVHIAVRLLCVSPDGSLLLYEVKEGGERTGVFHVFDIQTRTDLPDALPRGYLRGFAFAPDGRGFYYVHDAASDMGTSNCTAYHHILGTSFDDDGEIFSVEKTKRARLHIVPGTTRLGFLVYRFLCPTRTDCYVWDLGSEHAARTLIRDADYKFAPYFLKDGRILAVTDRDAPNFKIVEVQPRLNEEPVFLEVIPATYSRIQGCVITQQGIFVSYLEGTTIVVKIFDMDGRFLGHLPSETGATVRLAGASADGAEVFFERESFTKPVQSCRYLPRTNEVKAWAGRSVPFDVHAFNHRKVWFEAKDGTPIPMFLVGRPEVLEGGAHPAVMTSYGGYGVAMTPRFSAFAAFLMECGCLFALPNIRGGSEFGTAWYDAAKRQHRQTAFGDFLQAAEWLVTTGRTKPDRLAIFGGSNAGLLVAVAMTQRPDLFRAVLCMVPVLDMLRYHLFDHAQDWKEEFGTCR